jgi:predicted RNA-binding Zn-ribbon protein involved in translation (DUF1610 family)
MKTKILLSSLVLILSGITAFSQEGKETLKKTDTISVDQKKDSVFYYTCPMHIEVRQTAPGKCPICGMTLVKRSEVAHTTKRDKTNECLEQYECPSHPELQLNKPGKCPKCGENMGKKKPR